MSVWEEQLAGVLEKELALVNLLAGYADTKTDILKSGIVSGLDRLVNEEQPIVLQMQALEETRIALLKGYGLSGKTLRELVEVSGAPLNTGLQNLYAELKAACDRLKKRNDLNAEITKSRVQFYNQLRNKLDKPMYGQTGQKISTDAYSRMIDKKF